MPSDDLRERLRAIGAFRAELEAPGFDAGAWHRSERLGEMLTLPWFELSDRGAAFVRALAGIMLPGFDWPAWAQTPGARALHADRSILASASAEELAMLATALIRQDRFNEGSLGDDFASGLMAAIARRAAHLADGGMGRPQEAADSCKPG